MLQHLIIQLLLYYLSSGRLREVKNKRKFQTFGSKSGRGRLREVVANKRFQIWFGLETFGILENWSLRRGGHSTRSDRNRRFSCISDSLLLTKIIRNLYQVNFSRYIVHNASNGMFPHRLISRLCFHILHTSCGDLEACVLFYLASFVEISSFGQ